MPLTIIVKNKLKSIGRSDQEKRLRADGWGATMTDAQLDKMEYIERRLKKEGVDKETSLRTAHVDLSNE
jgi:hypothetical protein